MNRLFSWLSMRPVIVGLWAVYVISAFVGTHLPIPTWAADVVNLRDKLIHACLYFGMTLLTGLAVVSLRFGKRLPWPVLWVGLASYAAVDEFTQAFVRRTPDVRDWLSDAVGISLGLIVLPFVLSISQKQARSRRLREVADVAASTAEDQVSVESIR